jgi:DNA-binding response OmpR family regulator
MSTSPRPQPSASKVSAGTPHADRQPRRILVVEDQRDIAEMLVFNLGRAGYQATAVHDGRSALQMIEKSPPDLLLLDVMIPELSGTELASRLRSTPTTSNLPIIMLTARTEEVDQLVGLTVGADDYITKPFSMNVLLARIEAVLRRASAAAAGPGPAPGANILRMGEVEVNLDTHQVRLGNEPLRLTLTEFRLLAALLAASGRVLSRSHLINKAMGPDILVTERTIDVHMTALRKKLGVHGAIIQTVRGVGYRASQEPQTTSV